MSAIPTPAQDPALYSNRNGEIIGASVALLVLPTVFVAFRAASRLMSGAGFWWDDAMIALGMVFSWGLNITNILDSRDALGHHKEVLPLTSLMSFFKHMYAIEILYSLSIGCVKFSILLFLYRIFPIASFRRVIIACGAFVLAFQVASVFVFIFECTPIQDFWTTLAGMRASELGGRCIDLSLFLLVNGSINTVTDFALLLLPLPLLWKLKASVLQKCILTVIFVTGLVVAAVSMVRLVVIGRYHGDDLTYDFVPTDIWTAAEPSIGVVFACLPSLRPLFVRVFRIGGPKNISAQEDYFSSSNRLATTWRSETKSHNRTFSRLPSHVRSRTGSMSNTVAIYGGKAPSEMKEDIVELSSPYEEVETPINRIRAKTTVVLEVSKRVDWQDDLF